MNPRFARAALVVASTFVFMALAHARALAMVEYCGAAVGVTPVDAPKLDAASSTFALIFSANSARTVSGHVVFHSTDGAWYDVAFPAIDLEQRTRRYQSAAVQFSRTDFLSRPVFVTFSRPMSFSTAFVNAATVTNEHVLGWDANEHACAGYDPDPELAKPEGHRDITLIDPAPRPTMPPARRAGAPSVDHERARLDKLRGSVH